MSNIIDNLQESTIHNTAKAYPLNAPLDPDAEINVDLTQVYDHSFILPLFSSLLAPENNVQIYRFCRTGALSLTITALSSDVEETRAAAAYVLFRFYNHLEAQQGGQDKLIFSRLIDAICKGTAVLNELKMNNFSSIFFSRMALILTQPLHTMYLPLSQYLSAKSIPNISGVPELYTFLHSPDVNYKEHRRFILEILRDGLRTEHDLKVALKSMAFKLIMELFNSTVCDMDTKILILEILKKACDINKGARYLCNVHGLMSFLHVTVYRLTSKDNRLIPLIILLLRSLINTKNQFFDYHIFSAIIVHMIDHLTNSIKENDLPIFLETLYLLFNKEKSFLNETRLSKIINLTKSKDAEYLFYYGRKSLNNVFMNDTNDFIKLLTMKYFERES